MAGPADVRRQPAGCTESRYLHNDDLRQPGRRDRDAAVSIHGAETNGIPAGLAAATAEPLAVLKSGDPLLSQSVSAFNADGEAYQTTTTDFVNGTPQTQTGQTWYDGDADETATEDADGNLTAWTYNDVGQVTQSVQGQMAGTVNTAATSWAFGNLAQTSLTSAPRTYEVYVHLTAAPQNGWQGAFTVTDNQGYPLSVVPANSDTPTVGGWYDLGSVTLVAGDLSTTVTLAVSGGESTQDVACLGYADSDSYDPATGELHETIDRDGRATVYHYNDLGEETSEQWYATTNTTTATPTETIATGYTGDGQVQFDG